jgi:hypothetical protein
MRVRLSTQDITDDALGCDRLPEKCHPLMNSKRSLFIVSE